MAFRKFLLAGVIAASAIASTAAQAGVLTGAYTFSVVTGDVSGGFNAVQGANPFIGGTATASFTYTGALNFSNTAPQNPNSTGDLNSAFFTSGGGALSGYSGSGNFLEGNDNYGSGLAGFLAGSGSAANYAYASFYTINLGVLDAGTVLSITHDDGASIYQGSTQIGSTVVGPTSVVTDFVTITNTAATVLYYSRQNGSPSILQVSAVPEASTWAMMILGFCGLGFMAYRRKAASALA